MIIEAGEAVAAVFLGLNAVIDVKKRRISLVSAGTAGAAGIALHIYGGQHPAYILLGTVPGLLLLLLSLFSKGAVGMGDGIAAAAAGLLISPAEILASCGVGSLFAAGFAAIVWLRHRRGKDEIPFVPFLFAGYAAVLLIKICTGA